MKCDKMVVFSEKIALVILLIFLKSLNISKYDLYSTLITRILIHYILPGGIGSISVVYDVYFDAVQH